MESSQPERRDSLRPSSEALLVLPPDVVLFLTKRVIHRVCRCVVLTGSEDTSCSCSWSPRGSTSFALFPPTSECSSCSSLVESSQPERRDSLRPSSEALLVLPPDVALFLTKRVIHGVCRCVVLTGSEDPGCSCSWSPHGSTSLALFLPTSECSSCSSLVESSQPERRDFSPALIPPMPGDLGTGGRRLHVSDTNRLKSRIIRLGRMSIDVGMCRRIHSQLRKSDTRHVKYKPIEANHLRLQRKRRRRSCCPVLLCSSPPTRDVGAVTFSPLLFQSSTTG